MVPAPAPTTPAAGGRGRPPAHPPARGISWGTALVLGLCFGLGYGVVYRLLRLPPGQGFRGVQLFGVKAFPGTGLDTLRQRFGSGADQDIQADLERIERERKQRAEAKKEQEELARRQAELEEKERREQEREQERRREEDRDRFDALLDPADGEPSTTISPLLPTDDPLPTPPQDPAPAAAPAPPPAPQP